MSETWFFAALPCRPQPQPDECLSGYLLRLAQANNCPSFWDFAHDLFPTWQVFRQVTLLRWECLGADWGRLTERTQLAPAALQRLTMWPWLMKFRPPPVLPRTNTGSPGTLLQGIITPSLQVCPLCLQGQPYYRLLWRLAPVTICLEHSCLLQSRCQHCGARLTAVSPLQRLLYCTACGADLRLLPISPAPPELVNRQQRQQRDYLYLLDPHTTLIPSAASASEAMPATLRSTIGLKFRYLRLQAGLSLTTLAQRLHVADAALTSLELGRHAPLTLYLTYLEALSASWAEFAALEVPPDFAHSLHEPAFLPLRICPTAGCPNHEPPPQLTVRIMVNQPARRIVRLYCSACGRYFTRSYDGDLVTKSRLPLTRPARSRLRRKSEQQIADLTELSLQGMPNRQIAAHLGWSQEAVRRRLIALGLIDEVHQAQAQQRTCKQQDRLAQLRAQIAALLPSLFVQAAEITVSQISRALGYDSDYLGSQPELSTWIQEQIQGHNQAAHQSQAAQQAAAIMQALQEMQLQEQPVRIEAIVARAGFSCRTLRRNAPELHAVVLQAIIEHRQRLAAAHTQTDCDRINAAVADLSAQGARLSCAAILREAGVSKHRTRHNPILRDLLEQWLGDPAPGH